MNKKQPKPFTPDEIAYLKFELQVLAAIQDLEGRINKKVGTVTIQGIKRRDGIMIEDADITVHEAGGEE